MKTAVITIGVVLAAAFVLVFFLLRVPAKRVSVRNMRPGDVLYLTFESSGCFHCTSEKVKITLTGDTAEIIGSGPQDAARLSHGELLLLDDTLDSCRDGQENRSTTREWISAVHKRGIFTVAREEFGRGTGEILPDRTAPPGWWTIGRPVSRAAR